MRQFIVLGHDAPTTPEFSLSDLAGGAGRLDVLCRCVNAGLFVSHGIREDVRIHLVLNDEYTVRFDGSTAKRLYPNERAVASRIQGALEATQDAIGHQPAEVSPGVELYRMGFASTLETVDREGTVVECHEDGEPLAAAEPPEDPIFVLSDHHDFTADEAELLAETAERRLSVGPEILHADQTMTVVHNWVDTAGYTSY
ncbi:MAG: tRNA (pseudouridine(54)-N(1))-methyltransferase TrmY [Halohasta sp.]